MWVLHGFMHERMVTYVWLDGGIHMIAKTELMGTGGLQQSAQSAQSTQII